MGRRKIWPVEIYDSINFAMHKPFGKKLSSNDTQMVVKLRANFRKYNPKTQTAKAWKKKMYINLQDLLPYRTLLNDMFNEVEPKRQTYEKELVRNETKLALAELSRHCKYTVKGKLRRAKAYRKNIETNKKVPALQEVYDKHYSEKVDTEKVKNMLMEFKNK